MKIKKVISESKDGTRKEVIAEDDAGSLSTKHIHLYGHWQYCIEYDYKENRPRTVGAID